VNCLNKWFIDISISLLSFSDQSDEDDDGDQLDEDDDQSDEDDDQSDEDDDGDQSDEDDDSNQKDRDSGKGDLIFWYISHVQEHLYVFMYVFFILWNVSI
jgi:hypothetical protein